MHLISGDVCILSVGVLGISYKTAELKLREALARAASMFADERSFFFPHPTVLLSTCNRTEIYFSGPDLAQAQSDLLGFLRSQIDEPFEHRMYSYFAIDCFMHLCRVTSGLDSAILRETEIQRQVRIAYARAQDLFSLPSAMHYIFQKALKVSKTLRGEIELNRGAPTLYGTLWQIAEKELGDVSQKKILLVGYSEIHRGFLSFLSHKGVNRITLCTKSPSSVCLEGVRVTDRKILGYWQEYDWIVCASQSETYLLQGRSSNKHLIFDLSVPRNVDPQIALNPGVRLWNIEQINNQIEQKKQSYSAYVTECEESLKQNVLRLARLYRQKVLRAVFA